MAKKLHLHIGSYKTGTTSIQNLFHNNRNKLARQGFIYPGNTFNHHQFFFATKSKEKDWPRQFKGYDKDKLNTSLNNFFEILEKWITSDYQQQVISTEYLFIENPEYVRNVINYLEKFYSEITVYLFVRDPVEYYRSMQQQTIKARSYITSPNSFRYPFAEVVGTWSQFCEVKVIEYSRSNDSSKTFCELIGLDTDKLSQPDRQMNSSLSLEQMILLEKIQRHIYAEHEDLFKKHLGFINKIKAEFTTTPKLQKEIKPVIYKNHSEAMKWLKEEYEIDFFNQELEKDSLPTATFKNGKSSVREVYQVEDEESVEKYEALVMDALLKNLVQQKK